MNISSTSNINILAKRPNLPNKVQLKDFEKMKETNELGNKEKLQLQKLKQEDQRVRAHENAHKAAAGNLSTSSPNYKYKIGPDGKRYAVGGDVKIDISEVPNDPDETIRKARQIKNAALAPSDPSQQDLKVAMESSRMEARAQLEKSGSKNSKQNLNDNIYKNKIDSAYKKSDKPSIVWISA